MASVLMLAASGTVRGRLLLPVNHHIADGAVTRGMLGDPAAATHGKTLEGSFADIPVDEASVASGETLVGFVPLEDGLAVDVVEEDGRWMRGQFAVAQPNLETLARDGIEDRSGVGMSHPEDLG